MREKRPGVWEVRAFVGRDESGRVRHLSRTVRGGKRDAQRALVALQAEAQGTALPAPSPLKAAANSAEESPRRGRTRPKPGAPPPRAPVTFAWGPDTTINDAIEAWRNNGWADLSPSTARKYKSLWEVHIKGSIGAKRITSVGPYDVEQFFRDLKEKGLGQASVRQSRALLHRACKLARKWSNQTLPNPVADTEMPVWTLDEQPKEVRSPSREEVRKVLRAAMEWDERFGAFVRIVVATGARRGEVAAIRWSDIDFDAGIVTIDEGIIAEEGGARPKSPKTRASVRRIAVDSGTIEVLRRWKANRDEWAAGIGLTLKPECFVFASDADGVAPPHPDYFSHAFERVRAVAGLPKDVHLHSIRHFQSTELDSVISEAQKQARMGWATIKMARHYTDVVTTEDRRAADHIGTLLEG